MVGKQVSFYRRMFGKCYLMDIATSQIYALRQQFDVTLSITSCGIVRLCFS